MMDGDCVFVFQLKLKGKSETCGIMMTPSYPDNGEVQAAAANKAKTPKMEASATKDLADAKKPELDLGKLVYKKVKEDPLKAPRR